MFCSFCCEKNHISSPKVRVAKPAILAAKPLILPRCFFGITLPSTSFAATELKPRAKLNNINKPKIAKPACFPSNTKATPTMANIHIDCAIAPITHTHLRTDNLRITSAMANCGSKEPDSLIGTSQAIKLPGTFKLCINQGSVTLGLSSASANLLNSWLSNKVMKLPGTSLHADSSISLQALASSSLLRRL